MQKDDWALGIFKPPPADSIGHLKITVCPTGGWIGIMGIGSYGRWEWVWAEIMA
jgi:hypothetical protein